MAFFLGSFGAPSPNRYGRNEMVRKYFRMRDLNTFLKTAMRVAGIFIILAVAASSVRAGYYFRIDKDVQGRVIDGDSKQPLPGVVVMAIWVTEHSRITIEPEERYYDYFETLTDENGEFTIPGKGRNFFRNMPPPKIRIYKAGYGIRDIRFEPTGYPTGLSIKFKDGKRFISCKKLPMDKRKEYVSHYRQIPYSGMGGIPSGKYRLYSTELARDCQALGISQWWTRDSIWVIRKEGSYPATGQAVSPRNQNNQ